MRHLKYIIPVVLLLLAGGAYVVGTMLPSSRVEIAGSTLSYERVAPGALNIYRKNKLLQHISILHEEFPRLESTDETWGGVMSSLVTHDKDINFDGFNDLEVLIASNRSEVSRTYQYYVYNEFRDRYEPVPTRLQVTEGIHLDPLSKTVVTYKKDGYDYQRTEYRFDGSDFVWVRPDAPHQVVTAEDIPPQVERAQVFLSTIVPPASVTLSYVPHTSPAGFEFRHPADWTITGMTKTSDYYQLLARVVNPDRAGRPDTDVPIEQLSMVLDNKCLNASATVEGALTPFAGRLAYDTGWFLEGFAGLYYREVCVPKGARGITISASAYDETGATTMNAIFDSFTLAE